MTQVRRRCLEVAGTLAVIVGSICAPSMAEAVTLSGTIRYTGTHGPVSASRRILVYLTDTPTPSTTTTLFLKAKVSTNPGAFSFEAPAAGNYYMFYSLDEHNDGSVNIGTPFAVYNGRCNFPGDPIAVPGTVQLELGDTCFPSGIAGNMTYNGALGPVSEEGPLCLQAFLDPDLLTNGWWGPPCGTNQWNSGEGYDMPTFDTRTYYLRAFLDLNGNGAFDGGEPFQVYNSKSGPPGDSVVASTMQTDINFTFGDENVTPPIHLSGTIRYTGSQGPVSSNRPIRIRLHTDPLFENPAGPGVLVTTNGGVFDFTVPAAGDYFLAYGLDVIPDGKMDVGEPCQFYNNRFTPPGDPLHVPQSGLSDVSLTFDDTGQASGVAGTVTYTGTLGQVSGGQPLVIERFLDPDLTVQPNDGFKSSTTVGSNNGSYGLVILNTNVDYLRAFFDLNGNNELDPGEPFEIYNGKGAPPGDAVVPSPTQTNINFNFGDENVTICTGDCGGDGQVTVDELVTMVNIALGNADVSGCAAGDLSDDGKITVDEILTAVNHALNGC